MFGAHRLRRGSGVQAVLCNRTTRECSAACPLSGGENNWKRGRAIDVEGNISYLCCYAYKVLHLEAHVAIQELSRLAEEYDHEEHFCRYCRRWMADFWILQGDLYRALELNKETFNGRDDVLSLKLPVGERLTGQDILAGAVYKGTRLTAWGKAHIGDIEAYLDVLVKAYENRNNINLLTKWRETSHQYRYSVFIGTALSRQVDVPCFSFSRNQETTDFMQGMIRETENTIREERGIPRVGERWVGEVELYYALREALPEAEVIHHSRPPWLGRKHLDVYIPQHRVAVEYQGLQHDSSVEYFGGEEAFKATRRRDAAKKRACTKNGVRLIEVRPGYSMDELVRDIRSSDIDWEKQMGRQDALQQI